MTQTNFHRRTLSDLFSHTGAARLSMLMDESSQKSPRSDTTIYSHNAVLDKILDDKEQIGYEYDDVGGDNDEKEQEDEEEEEDGILLTPMEYDSIENDATFNYLDDGNNKIADSNNGKIRRSSSNCLADAVLQTEHLKSSYSDIREKTGNFSPEKLAGFTAGFTGSSYCSPGQPPLVTVFSPASLNDHHRRLNFGSLDDALRNGEAANAAGSGIIRDNTEVMNIESNVMYESTIKNGTDALYDVNNNDNNNVIMDCDSRLSMDVEIGTPRMTHTQIHTQTHTHSEACTDIPIRTLNSRMSSSSDPNNGNAAPYSADDKNAMCVVMNDINDTSDLCVQTISDFDTNENTEDYIEKGSNYSENGNSSDWGHKGEQYQNKDFVPKTGTPILNPVMPLSPIRGGTVIRRGTMDPDSRTFVTSTSTSTIQTHTHASTDTSMSTCVTVQNTDMKSVRDSNDLRQVVCKDIVMETIKYEDKEKEKEKERKREIVMKIEKEKGKEEEKEKEKGLKRSTNENINSSERLSYPVPVPPPGSSRPSSTSSSSTVGAGGVLSGLKNFRSHFGGSGVKNNGTNNGNISSNNDNNDSNCSVGDTNVCVGGDGIVGQMIPDSPSVPYVTSQPPST